MNIPNMLTILRIILVPIYMFVFFSDLDNRLLLAGLVFILAGISDVLDGHIARKYNLQTKLGTVLDPFADKLMTFAILISFTLSKLIPEWILIALGIKEIILILGGSLLYFSSSNEVVPSNKYGKSATALFYAATLSIVFKLPETLSQVLFLVTVVFNILALINYVNIYIELVKNREVSVDKE
ncbi:MAG: CDP-diacylglycerol--glycerol-3-phosphate 3-phosphatidyltransferase [Tissierella sp.]|nr:CDP-diacylglycerol--glycerol-3-phosphate 3-phosphatidyltransferase [Tissierella sp.]